MVSFFGIKLGSDRKKDKAQNKQNDKTAQSKKGSGDKTKGRESQYFGNNFSRPTASTSPRPGTSYSTRRTTLFHQPFTFPPASSSMVDLAPPGRRPSVGSLRQASSDAQLRDVRGRNESPVPPPVLAPPTRRPGTADRPLSSRKSAWINPFDTPFVRDPEPVSQPDTPQTNSGSATMSPFSDFEFGLAPKGSSAGKSDRPANEGYPSPPASISSIDPLSSVPAVNPDQRPSSSRRNAPPSGLRRVNTLDEIERPPTPERTVSQTSYDQPSTGDNKQAVVRNVRAKRETLAFHQPRQPSMVMDLDGLHEKKWERDAGDDTNRSPPIEGFEGNFAAFDFGETVRRASMSMDIAPDDKRSTAHTMHTISNFSGHPSLDTMGSALGALWPSPPTDLNDAASFGGYRDRALSDARSLASLKREETVRPPASVTCLDSPIIPPDHFRNRDLIPPRPHTSGGPRPTTGPPPAAAGAHRNAGPGGLDPPPRGFLSRPRVGSASGPSTRAPPKPLQLRPLADRSDPSPRNSPYGPPPDEGSYMRAEGESRQPTELSPYGPTLEGEGNYMRGEGSARRPPDVPGSPFARATPIEGDFPVSKGLPRGRRPTFPSQNTPTSEDTTAPSPVPDNTTALGLPSWIDRASARQSALPAPLSPLRGAPTSAPRLPTSPHRPLRSDEFKFPDTPTSASTSDAPRLPSPTFHSLEKSISSSSENLARTFMDFSFDSKPLISPVLGEFVVSSFGRDAGDVDGRSSPRRVEGRSAPPRPSPVTLPPSSNAGVKTGATPPAEFTSTFI